MGCDWEKTSLGKVADIIDSIHKTPQYVEVGTPMVRVVDVKGGVLNLSETKKVSPIDYTNYSKGRDPEVGDLIISRVGSYGNIAYVNDATNRFCLGQNTALVVPKIHWRYLYFQLISPDIKSQIEESVVGAVQKTISLKNIKALNILAPPLSEQKRIAHILGSLDDKIELNRKMNATLEGMAQALFKSWFVDFDPVIDNALAAGNPIPEAFAVRAETRRKALADGTANRDVAKQFAPAFQFTDKMGWIPEEWKVKSLSDFGKIVTGKTPSKAIEYAFGKSSMFLTPTDYDGNILTIETNRRLSRQGEEAIPNARIEKGSICVTCIGSQMGRTTLITEEAFTNQQINSILPNSPIKRYYILITLRLRRDEIFAIGSSGSTMPIVNKGIFSQLSTLRPNDNTLEKFNSYLSLIIDKIKKNSYQSQTLSKLRNTLLPKLISGEIRIPDVEKIVKEIEL